MRHLRLKVEKQQENIEFLPLITEFTKVTDTSTVCDISRETHNKQTDDTHTKRRAGVKAALPPAADQIALPDFNAGAMENWGLITYRETALLYDEAFSSNSNKERIATIIAHELAHMVRPLRWLQVLL